MPLSKKQSTSITKELKKIFGSAVVYTTDMTPEGACAKVVAHPQQINTSQLGQIMAITQREECEINMRALTQNVALTFYSAT